MNVRFSEGEVRVRVDRAEAERLAAGQALSAEVWFPGGTPFRWRVEPGEGEPSASFDAGVVRVSVPVAEVRDLLSRPPAKDLGVYADLGDLRVAVEVDAHSGKKR